MLYSYHVYHEHKYNFTLSNVSKTDSPLLVAIRNMFTNETTRTVSSPTDQSLNKSFSNGLVNDENDCVYGNIWCKCFKRTVRMLVDVTFCKICNK